LIIGEDLASSNAQENFDYLWTECSERYAYFDLKDIDWEAVRVTYQAQITEGMDDFLFFRYRNWDKIILILE